MSPILLTEELLTADGLWGKESVFKDVAPGLLKRGYKVARGGEELRGRAGVNVIKTLYKILKE